MARKTILPVIILLAAAYFAEAQNVDFKQVDFLFKRGEGNDYLQCRELLLKMLPQAGIGAEKADVLWRLSKASVVLGEKETTKEGKRKVFGEGIAYAAQAIAQDPKDPQAYMWHCANTGRECQTHNLMEQAAAVAPMMHDISMILDSLGRSNCSEAWQAKAEIYYNHPFKSNDDAILFARNAVKYIPKEEMRISTYAFLAKMLWDRNWSASRRKDSISDREEARQLINKAMKRYESSPEHSVSNTRDYNAIVELLSTMK